MRVNLGTGSVALGSDYPIYTDFNAGVQEWYIPAPSMGLTSTSAFDYQFVAYDENGTEQVTPGGSFDFMKLSVYLRFHLRNPTKCVHHTERIGEQYERRHDFQAAGIDDI